MPPGPRRDERAGYRHRAYERHPVGHGEPPVDAAGERCEVDGRRRAGQPPQSLDVVCVVGRVQRQSSRPNRREASYALASTTVPLLASVCPKASSSCQPPPRAQRVHYGAGEPRSDDDGLAWHRAPGRALRGVNAGE